MGLFDKLRRALGGGRLRPAASGRNYWFHVRCAACGEVIQGRVDIYNELSMRDDAEGYFVRKVLIGPGRCYKPIEVTLFFDADRRLVERQISGGEFVAAETPESI